MQDVDEKRRKRVHGWMLFIGSCLTIGLLAVVGRVYYLQTVEEEKLRNEAADQSNRNLTLKASRGAILDRNGVEMAVTVEVPSIYARPKRIGNPKKVAKQLAPHLETEVDSLAERLDSDKSFIWLDRKAKPSVGDAVEKLKLDHIGMVPEHKRYYPLGSRAGQLLGFVGVDDYGLEGLERTFEEELAGGEIEVSGLRDARGRTLLTREIPELRKLEGNSVVLTIDERIQRVAEEAINRQVEKYDAKGGYAIVMDVDSGDVLAMANTPKFDPNRFQKYDSNDWRLRSITDTFEPGSTIKPLVLAAAMEEGTVNLGTSFDCEDGRMRIDGYTINDSHDHEDLTAAEIIQKSSNIGAYKIAKTIGKESYYEYLRDFGFGQRTNLGLRGEQPGLVWPPDRWADVTFANVAFGQGLTATPLQVVRAMAAVANDGMLLEPRLVKEIRDKDGEVVEQTEPTLVRRVVSRETSEKVARAMSLVTGEEGTGTNAALDNFTVAGKTGTAQKVNPETRRYDPDMWVGSFAGFVPAERPEYAIAVMIDEPQDSHYGGVVAAPAFRKIAEEALAMTGVEPVPEHERFVEREDDEDDDANSESDASDETKLAAKEKRAAGESGDDGSVAAEKDVEGPTVPDFRGMTMRKALEKARKIGMLPEVEGWGRVVEQNPRPGRPLDASDSSLKLTFAPQYQSTSLAETPSSGAE